MRFPSTFAAGAGLVLFACPLAAQTTDDPKVRHSAPGTSAALSTGIEYEEGDYGTGQRVSTISIPASLRLSSGQFQFIATLPYVRVDAPGNVVGGGGLFGLPIVIDPGSRPRDKSVRGSAISSWALSTPCQAGTSAFPCRGRRKSRPRPRQRGLARARRIMRWGPNCSRGWAG